MLMRIDYVVTHSQSLQKMILCANKPRTSTKIYNNLQSRNSTMKSFMHSEQMYQKKQKTCLQNITHIQNGKPILVIHCHAYAYVKLVIDIFFNGCIVSHFLIIYRGFTFSAILVFSSPSCVVILKRNFLICMLILARSCYGYMTQSIKRVWLRANLFEVNSTRKLG